MWKWKMGLTYRPSVHLVGFRLLGHRQDPSLRLGPSHQLAMVPL
jgi:hypothetical protein